MSYSAIQTLNGTEERTLELATSWFIQTRAGLSDAQKREMLAWMRADPENAAALDIVSRSWTTAAQAARTEMLAPPLRRARRLRLTGAPGVGGFQNRRSPVWRPAVMAAAGAVLVMAGLAWNAMSVDASYSTSRGEQLAVDLPDGSRVKLDAASRVDVRFTPLGRHVRVNTGEAEFDVGRDRWRPFRVDTRNVQIWDRGTRFAVQQRGADVHVVLMQGRVELHDPITGTLRASLVPGQAATAAGNGRISIAQADVVADLAWKQGDLVLKGTSVADALDEIGARMPVSFVYADPALKRFPISGVFHMSDPAGFLTAVASLYPVSWRETAPGRFEVKVRKGAVHAAD